MAEYILPAALIGITLLGGFAWCLNESSGQQSLLKSAQGDHLELGANGQTALVSKTFGKNPNGLTLRYQLPNGSFIELNNVPNNPGLSVEVDGVNGTTEQILAALEQLITQLEKNGTDANTVSGLKNLATKGYLLADDQKALESVIAACGEDKQCVQRNVFGNLEMSQKVFGLTFDSCFNPETKTCDPKRLMPNVHEFASERRLQSLEAIMPDFKKMVSESPVYNFEKNNLIVGHQLGEFLDAYQIVKQSQFPNSDTSQLVEYLSQSIFRLSISSANSTAPVGTIVGFFDVANTKNLALGSAPDIKPTDYNGLVAKEIAQSVPNLNGILPNSVQTGNHSSVICAEGLGRQEDGTCR